MEYSYADFVSRIDRGYFFFYACVYRSSPVLDKTSTGIALRLVFGGRGKFRGSSARKEELLIGLEITSAYRVKWLSLARGNGMLLCATA